MSGLRVDMSCVQTASSAALSWGGGFQIVVFIDDAFFAGMPGEGGLLGGTASVRSGKIANVDRERRDGKIILPRVSWDAKIEVVMKMFWCCTC